MIKNEINPTFAQDQALKEFIQNLPEKFEQEGKVLFKERNEVKSFTLKNGNALFSDIIIKKYKRPNFIQRIAYSFFRKSKAHRAFIYAAELRKRNVNTPQEIAYIEDWQGGLFLTGYFISLSDYAPPIEDKLTETHFDKPLAASFAHFAAYLHQQGVLHHDLNCNNVLFTYEAGEYTFSVIDINRMKFYPDNKQPDLADCFENLTRFTKNMELYAYVVKSYIAKRNLENPELLLQKAIKAKIRHDEQRIRRKKTLKKLKNLF